MNQPLHPSQASRSAAVKATLDYPVIDTDVHVNDYAPVLEDYVQHYGGGKLVDALRKALGSRFATRSGGKDWYQQTPAERQDNRTLRSPWWARVTRNTLDLATYTLPELLNERLAEQGADYSVLFPNDVLAPLGAGDEFRQPLHRAINHFHADQYRKYSDRLTPVAGIPLNTPQEGIEELEFAVKTLGLKVINIAGGVKRPIKAIARKYPAADHPEIARHASYIDFYGIDSEYDYDPFWAKVVELGVPVTTHYGSQGWTGRHSISNYMFNHIGHFADGSQAFAKALFFGGVTRRFPNLRVALLEGGADWARTSTRTWWTAGKSATAPRCRTTTRPTPTWRCCTSCSSATAPTSSAAATSTRSSCCATAWASRPCRTAATRTRTSWTTSPPPASNRSRTSASAGSTASTSARNPTTAPWRRPSTTRSTRWA